MLLFCIFLISYSLFHCCWKNTEEYKIKWNKLNSRKTEVFNLNHGCVCILLVHLCVSCLSLFPATICTFILLRYSFVIAEFHTLVLSFVSPKPLVLSSLRQPQHTSTCTPSSQTDLVCLQSQSPKTACGTQCPSTYGVRMQGCVYVCVVWKNVLRLPETLSFTTEKKKLL